MKKLTPERQKELFGLEPTVIVKYEKKDGQSVRHKYTEYEPNAVQEVRKLVGMPKTKITIRNCLGCAEKFESEGIHNRMCLDCANYGGMI